jgi:hypothetical protein
MSSRTPDGRRRHRSPSPGLEADRLWWSSLPALLECSPSTVVRRLRPALVDEHAAASPDELRDVQEENQRRRALRIAVAKRLDLRRRPTGHPLTPYRYHVRAEAARALAAEWAARRGRDEPVED